MAAEQVEAVQLDGPGGRGGGRRQGISQLNRTRMPRADERWSGQLTGRQSFVESLARGNRAFYGTTDGRDMLRVFELTFEHRWIYVFDQAQYYWHQGRSSHDGRS